MKYAVVNNYMVEEIVELFDENEISDKARSCQNMIDITNMSPQPNVGWKFDGLQLVYIGE
jgi:hypothetical protein